MGAFGWLAPTVVRAAPSTPAIAPTAARVGFGWTRPVPAGLPQTIVGWSRDTAMSVPTISRARDLICSTVANLRIVRVRETWTDGEATITPLDPQPWQLRPDPRRTSGWLLAWTVDDLLFHGVAYWRVTARYAPDTAGTRGYPAGFERMPADEVHVDTDGQVRWLGREVPTADVVEFLSPIEGMLRNGWRTIGIAVDLDEAASRFAGTEVPAGWLKQTGGEPLSADELAELATGFNTARRSNTTAALNEWVDYHESTYDPARMQLVEAREHQAVELARLANVPAYLVGAPTGTGMTYQNAEQARADLVDFGALPYIGCLEQTLSGPNVTPAGQLIRLDLTEWLRSRQLAGDITTEDTPDA